MQPSAKQIAARNRNWKLFRLKGLRAQTYVPELFTSGEIAAIHAAIDSAMSRIINQKETTYVNATNHSPTEE